MQLAWISYRIGEWLLRRCYHQAASLSLYEKAVVKHRGLCASYLIINFDIKLIEWLIR